MNIDVFVNKLNDTITNFHLNDEITVLYSKNDYIEFQIRSSIPSINDTKCKLNQQTFSNEFSFILECYKFLIDGEYHNNTIRLISKLFLFNAIIFKFKSLNKDITPYMSKMYMGDGDYIKYNILTDKLEIGINGIVQTTEYSIENIYKFFEQYGNIHSIVDLL